MIRYDNFIQFISHNRLQPFQQFFQDALEERHYQRYHGDRASWEDAIACLPEVDLDKADLQHSEVTLVPRTPLSPEQQGQLETGLRGLHPWRKGPFNFFDVRIDTEWRSDWKWDRLQPHISDLDGRFVLDVGCGSGYHCWRMRGDGAAFVLGVDPSPKFAYQFECVKRYLPDEPVFYLPLRSEDLPPNMQAFDTVFSMGVLYHRRAPFDHIDELKSCLKPGGELVLETLVIEGDENAVLTPADRYAQMRNVWFIGSSAATKRWLERCGFVDVRVVDETRTSLEEQRATDWMRFQSLQDFLDPNDYNLTVEGYPAPCRAVFVARKP